MIEPKEAPSPSKVLVTGGSGDIGSAVVAQLRNSHALTILDRRPSKDHPDLPFLHVDLENSRMTASLVRGFDCVVHLAAIPDPFADPADQVFRVNMLSTFNLLEAARHNGIGRIVYGCSESASGFGIHNRAFRPDYFPIDERHRSIPHEAYGSSKYLSEILAQQYALAYDIEVISLRYAWAWGGRRNQDDWMAILRHGSGGGPKDWLGAWIAHADIAQGVGLAVRFQFAEPSSFFERFYLTARDNFTDLESLDLVTRQWPEDPPPIVKPDLYAANPRASLFDIAKAEHQLGFSPTVDLDDLRAQFRISRS